MPTILVVDDEPNIIEVLEMVLQDEGMEVLKAGSGQAALALLRDNKVDLVISDIKMPDFSGIELLQEAKPLSPDTVFIMITAFASTETAIEALQHGAYDYITKPFKMEGLRAIVRRALAKKQNQKQCSQAPSCDMEAIQGQKLFQALQRSHVVGRSPKMVEIYRTIGTVAMGDSTVLITGESGTGKELVARAIHEASHRKDRDFVSINCSAFPETLLESELFGYLKGAFTGAANNKKGLFEAAGGGSIFLDEIGDMTPAMQVKLLRVLQERRLRPLGGTAEVPVDVRVIAATNQDLQSRIQQGLFREDLFYRIAVINVHLPALRERAEDIGLLASFFLRQYSERAGKSINGISPEALCCLQSYSWPGNVRQLENTIERAVALETTREIQLERLPETIRKGTSQLPRERFTLPEGPFDLESFLSQIESSLIHQALDQTDGNQTLAAQKLNLTKGSLRHRLQSLQIKY
ncbi:MAG: two component, sigma54 specific, transcriptional regulator, Fis family [Acidobacteria bacterium]|jgi:two-component system, NtrC family, response regulator PilR|nr:two component, sigma54 specific, transcriptional regulator, Fis family [Acidobacteriota bacterium]